MKLRIAVCLLPFALVFSAAVHAREPIPSVAAAPSVTLPPALDRVLRNYEKAWIAGDVDALAALFVTEGYALPNGQPPAAGADAIRKAYRQNAGSALSLRALHYAESGDMAYIVGGFGWEAGKPDFGKFVLVLRRGNDGRWRIAADIDNANAPPKAPAEKKTEGA